MRTDHWTSTPDAAARETWEDYNPRDPRGEYDARDEAEADQAWERWVAAGSPAADEGRASA